MDIQNLVNRINQARNSNLETSHQISNARSEVRGRKPSIGGSDGPYAYVEIYPNGGYELGAGVVGHRTEHDEVDALSVNGKMGAYEENGNTRGGARLRGGVVNSKINILENQQESGEVSETAIGDFEMNFVSVTAETSGGDDGFTGGVTGTLLDAAYTFGERDPESSSDSTSRVGLGLGGGFAIRGHWDDADNDGHRESGMGIDLGFISLDVKQEDWIS